MINTKKIETTFPPEPFVTAEQEKQVSKNTKDFILNRVAGYFKKPFFQSVATVTIGTIFAQTISAAFSPLITRLYGPEAFGILGVFITITNILIPLATLTYSVSIVLPAQDRDAKDLVRLSFLTALTVAFVCALVLFFSQNIIVNLLQIRTIEKFLYLVPIVLFFSACTQIIQQWMIRKKQYKTNATIDVISSLSINTAKAGGGLLWPFSSTLIILSAFGHFLSAMLMSFGAKKTFDFSSFSLMPTQGTLSRLKDIAKRYSDFPIFRAPQIFL
ncbi:MAG: oligosaccharide flippase family protein, partial [Phycisphaerae bacterium]